MASLEQLEDLLLSEVNYPTEQIISIGPEGYYPYRYFPLLGLFVVTLIASIYGQNLVLFMLTVIVMAVFCKARKYRKPIDYRTLYALTNLRVLKDTEGDIKTVAQSNEVLKVTGSEFSTKWIHFKTDIAPIHFIHHRQRAAMLVHEAPSTTRQPATDFND